MLATTGYLVLWARRIFLFILAIKRNKINESVLSYQEGNVAFQRENDFTDSVIANFYFMFVYTKLSSVSPCVNFVTA